MISLRVRVTGLIETAGETKKTAGEPDRILTRALGLIRTTGTSNICDLR